jgi:hypothetical protein
LSEDLSAGNPLSEALLPDDSLSDVPLPNDLLQADLLRPDAVRRPVPDAVRPDLRADLLPDAKLLRAPAQMLLMLLVRAQQ